MAPAVLLHVFLNSFLFLPACYREHLPAYVAGIDDLVEVFCLRIPFPIPLGMALLPDLCFLLRLYLEDPQAYLQDIGKAFTICLFHRLEPVIDLPRNPAADCGMRLLIPESGRRFLPNSFCHILLPSGLPYGLPYRLPSGLPRGLPYIVYHTPNALFHTGNNYLFPIRRCGESSHHK